MLDPLAKLPIYQTMVLPVTLNVPLALLLSNLNASSNTSVMFTLVALEGPKLVTVIVKVTLSLTLTLSGVAVLTIARLTLGTAVTLVLLVIPVVFSVELTLATLSKVPFLKTVTLKLTLKLVPFSKLPTFQTIVLPSNSQVKLVLLPSNLNASSSTSVMFTFVALEGPKLVTVIVKVTLSLTLTSLGVAVLTISNLTTGIAVTLVSLVAPVLFSVELTVATLVNVPFFKTVTL